MADTTYVPLFLDTQPDWTSPVAYVLKWHTVIVLAEDGSEQRVVTRTSPRVDGTWVVTHERDRWPKRQAQVRAETVARVVVPMWPFWWQPTDVSMLHHGPDPGLTFEDGALRWTPFRVGGYVYIEEDGKPSVFVKVRGFLDDSGAPTVEPHTTIRLPTFTGTQYADWPVVEMPNYTTACRVHPCLLGVRQGGRGEFRNEHLGVVSEVYALEGL